MPRDACIAHQVALFNAQQQQLGEGREDGAYADWVERRVQYFAATTPPHCKQEEEVMEEGSAVELELDDLPSWRRDRETQDMSRNGSSVTAAEASSNGGAVVVLGLAMAVAVVAVAFSSQGREGGSFSSSPPVPQRSVLRELALAVWW